MFHEKKLKPEKTFTNHKKIPTERFFLGGIVATLLEIFG